MSKTITFYGFLSALILLGLYTVWHWYPTLTYTPEEVATLENEYLSEEEFQLAVAKYQTLVNEQDPSSALIQLREDAEVDSRLANACHAIAHMIGHASYERFASFGEAMQFAEVACNNGYIHGLAEMHFESMVNIDAEILATCEAYNPDTSLGVECRHGVGHGLMLAHQNDIYSALESCNLYPTARERYSCHTGAFMENFHTNQLYHPSLFIDEADPFSLCRELDEQYHRACDRYAIHYYIRANDNDFSAGLQRCAEVRSAGQEMCALGVGDLAIKEHFLEPTKVERLCESAQSLKMKEGCITGMSSLYVNQFGDIQQGLAMCETLQPDNRAICRNLIQGLPENYYERATRDPNVEMGPADNKGHHHGM